MGRGRVVGILAVALVLCGTPAFSQETDPTEPPAVPAALPEPAPAPAPAAPRIRFNFKGATFDQVIDFFSRATGLPVVREADLPQGTLDYLAPEEYTLPEALEVLNIILHAKGVALRVSDDMLYLQKLTEMQREDIPVYVGKVPAEVGNVEIVTVVRPLNIANAKQLAEKLAAMVASYGSVTAMENQNSLVITETAGQVRRLLTIVDELDRQDPEGAVEIFAIRHAKASDLMGPLKALLGQRTQKLIIDQQGKQVKIEEDDIPGLSISSDDRTNSIIAKGVQSRIDRLREVLALLDVPAIGGRGVRTFALARTSPQDAAARLTQLHSRLPEAERPVVLALDDLAKVTVVGAASAVEEAAALLRELDGPEVATGEAPRVITAVALEHADPASVAAALRSLLNGRQLVATRMVPGPDGKTLVLSGTESDVAAMRALLPLLDRPLHQERMVRLYRLTSAEPQAVFERSRDVYRRQAEAGDPRWALDLEFDRGSRLVTAIGAAQAQQRFSEVLRMVEGNTVVERETRQIELAHATPSRLAGPLGALARQMLEPRDGSPYVPPQIDAVDSLQLLIITAQPSQFPAIESLVGTLDRPGERMPPLRILQLQTADAGNLARMLTEQYQGRSYDERREKPVSVSADPQTNALVVAAHPDLFREIEALVEELNQVQEFGAGEREIRIFPLAVARAEELSRTLDEMFPQPPVPRDQRGRPMFQLQKPREVVVRADRQTNSLIVDAPIERMAGFEKLVEQLDRAQIVEGTEVRTYHVLRANLDAAANTLRQLAAGGSLSPSGQDRRVPVTVSTEPVSRSLIVSGPGDVFPRVEAVLHQLDARNAGPTTALRFFKLQNARAEALVPMLRDILVRRVIEDVADAGADPSTLLNLTADRKSNTLVISAPPPVLTVADSLVRELDHPITASGAVDVRVFQLAQASAPTVADAVRRALESRAQAEGDDTPFAVAPEPSSNTIVVTASPRRMEQTAAIVEELDGAPPAGGYQVRTVFLKHARAERVGPIVSELLGREAVTGVADLPNWARLPIIQAQMARDERQPAVRVAADARLNAVVISAPAALVAIAEQMVVQLDVDPAEVASASTRSVRVLVIENAGAAELATSLGALFEQEGEGPPVIRVDAGSNSLLVLATEEQFRKIEQVAGDVDRATIAASREMRLIPIDPARASAEDLARSLEKILGRSGRAVNVMTLDELLERRRLKEEEPPEPPRDGPGSALPETVPSLRGKLAALALAAAPGEKDPGSFSDGLIIAADPATNSLVVVGTPRSIDRVADLARQLAAQFPQAPDQIHYVGLPASIDAQATANLLSQALAQMSPPGGQRGDLRRRVAVLADAANNALVVACNEFDFEVVADLIAALTRPATTEQVVVKIYPLHTITADRAAESVRRLLQPAAAGRGGPGRQGQRMRDLAVKLLVGDQTLEAVFDPSRVGVNVDATSNSLVVMGPPEAIAFVDQFVELLDQARVNVETTLKLYPLQHARARELTDTLRNIFLVRFQGMQGQGTLQPEFSADERTNTLLATAAPEQLAEVDALLEQLDRKLIEDRGALRRIELSAAQPAEAARILDQVVVGSDQARRGSTLIVPNDATGVLLVRASDQVMAEIDNVLKEIDRPPTTQFKVRSFLLERADAAAVADALQKLYDDRARIASSGRGRRAQSRQVSIIGDSRSRTLLVAASDEDFNEIKALASQFDSPQASQSLAYRVIQLKHARATEIQRTVQDLANDLLWNQEIFWFWGPQQRNQRRDQGTLAVRADARLNALIVTGAGDKFDVVEKLVEVLDAPQPQDEARVVKLYRLEHADVDIVAGVLLESYTDPNQARRWWEPANPTDLRVRSDARNKVIIVSGSAKQQEEIAALIANIDKQVAPGEQQMTVLAVEFAQAGELAQTLNTFLRDRARATGAAAPRATIVASQSANTLIVSAGAEDTAAIRDLVGRMDQPQVSGDRTIEIIALQEGDAEEIARILGQQFGRRGGTGVVATPDARTNSLIINAPRAQFAQAKALIERLDAPSASDETVIRTYALTGARAEEVVRILSETLQLDERGRTTGITIRPEGAAEAVEVRARIVADTRSNSVIVTATEQSLPAIEALIAKVDDVPAASPIEYRIITLKHALAVDVSYTLRQFLSRRGEDAASEPRIDYNRLANTLIIAATTDQFEQIRRIIEEIDQPSSRERITDFVPLRFAAAEQVQEALSVFYGPLAIEADTPGRANARIVADTASNSLVITADESEWANIRALLDTLDSEDYDASLQLKVIPLTYADARSVARAINEAFAAAVPDRRGAARQPPAGGPGEDRPQPPVPTVLVESQEWVRASAEPLTNSVIVSASRQRMRKIELIVAQLDVADYARLPPPGIIPVTAGNPAQLAESLTRLFGQETEASGGRKSLRIIADPASNSLIVRADDDQMRQVRALAEALQGQATAQGLSVHVLKLRSAAANRVAEAIRDAFSAKAAQGGSALAIDVDVPGNSLVIACTPALFAEIRATVDQLDGLTAAAGHGIFIIELQHVSPDAARGVVETIGLDKPPRADSASRLVSEPIQVAPLAGRNALIVVANPADRDTIVGLFKAIDSEPPLAEAHMRVIKLRNAQAGALGAILNEVLTPGEQQSQTPLALAVQEQVRRLAVHQESAGADLRLDLTQPVRIIADEALNALVISSTPANVDALAQIVAMFDQVPVTDSVTVQLFPLTNIAAEQFARIVRELFQQGKGLGGVPGTAVEGVPAGGVGRALLDEVALSVDERTNTVVAAGKADSLALVQVLYERLDHDLGGGWVEPRLIPLRFADAEDLAETLQAVLVDGADGIEASPLQRQVARMRMARLRTNGGRVLEADVFAPMTRLVIRPQPKVNALVLVGTPMNLEVVSELVHMLDVEAAAPGAAVRVYPLDHASASRLAPIVTRLFEQQVQAGTLRADDRVVVQPDERTNALVVSTSPTSFKVVEGLLDLLDRQVAPELQSIQRVDLVNASATRVAEMVQQLMDARLERLRRTEPETAELNRTTVLPDTRSNSLVVAAGPESLEVVKRLAADLDRSTLAEEGAVKVLSVSRANVDRIAETVNAIMERRYADMPEEIRAAQKPLVLTDPRSNSLLVAAGPDDLAVISDLVAKLEATPLNPAVRLSVVPIEGSQAEPLAARVQTLMRQRQQSLGRASLPSDQVTVEADLATNSLIVAASDENLQVVRDLVAALRRAEAEAAPGSVFEILQLDSSRAADVVDMLGDLYVSDANRRRGPDTVRVTADERLNAVLVGAPADDLAAIRSLVAQLDGTRPSTIVEIRYVSLSSANALETVSLIQNVLSGRGLGAQRSSRQATVLKYFREYAANVGDGEGGDGNGAGNGPPSEMEVSAAIRESITLTPDLRTNTVIVSAPAGAVRMIERMIRDLDASSMGAQNVRIFKLKNADALAMAEILTDLFNLARRGNLYVLKPREQPETEVVPATAPAGPAAADFLGSELTAVPDDRQELSITVDNRTNSLLVSGTPLYLDLVGEVVEKLDSMEANEREVFVYPLRNAAAAEVARVLTSFVEKEQEKLLGTLSPDQLGSAARLLEREVTIVGDDKSNTVLVSASPRYMDRVRRMVSELDIDPPQVLIQVMLAEVTLDSNLSWGVDTRYDLGPYGGDDLFIRGASSLASAFLPGLGIPAFSVSSNDFSLLLKALEAQGRIQVLSNPSVMAANNQPAHIQVGENIGRASSQSLSSGGTQQTLVEFLDIGVILDVTPSINPDGFVRMTIAPSITDLTNRNTQVSEDLSVPILTKREATTTVTVRDGQTIVLGGLIQDTYESRQQKVPLLGDIPLLGLLFRSELEETTKIELLIVLTPHVIISPTQFARVDELTHRQIGRMSLTPDEQQGLETGFLVPETLSWKERAKQARQQAPEEEPKAEPETPP